MTWEHLLGKTVYMKRKGALLAAYHLSDNEILMVDSGTVSDPEMLEDLDRRGLRVRAVLCTHLHIDHIANNQALIERHGAEIFAHPAEIAWAEKFYHGLGYPVSPLKVDEMCGKMGKMTIDGAEIGLIPTYGHSAGHMAYVTPDGVCCIGDAMMGKKLLEMAKMPYMEDVDQAIESMERLRETDFPYYIAAHQSVIDRTELDEAVDANIRKELELYDLIRGQIREEMPVKEAVQLCLQAAGIRHLREEAAHYVAYTAKQRVLALVRAGEFALEKEMIRPVGR